MKILNGLEVFCLRKEAIEKKKKTVKIYSITSSM